MHGSTIRLGRAIYYTTTIAFAIVYALTVTPFTVNFFRRIASAPETGLSLFHWKELPLSGIHEFFLPLFIVILEFISLRLAIGIWSELLSESSDRKLRKILIPLFVAFQAFPLFSVYYDARYSEYVELQSIKYAEDTFQDELAVYDRNITVQLDDYRILQADRQHEIDALGEEIRLAKGQILTLQTTSLTDPDPQVKRSAEELITELKGTIIRKETERDALKDVQQNSRPPEAPPRPERRGTDRTKRAPLPFTDLQFVVNNAITPNSLFALFISFIFPVIVFGAGYVFANANKRARHSPVPEVSMGHELEALARLPQNQQVAHAELLKTPIKLHLESLKTAHDLSRENTVFHIRADDVQEFRHAVEALIRQINGSNIRTEAKEFLIKELNAQLVPTPIH